MARSKSQLSVSLMNGVIVAELIHHMRFILRASTETMHMPSYSLLLDSFISTLSRSRRALLEYLRCDSANVTFFKRCQLNEELIVGSSKSQRGGEINRQSNRICYQMPATDHPNMFYVTVPFSTYALPVSSLYFVYTS
jgi:hypothetical protein